jgi:hypothetical protein
MFKSDNLITYEECKAYYERKLNRLKNKKKKGVKKDGNFK